MFTDADGGPLDLANVRARNLKAVLRAPGLPEKLTLYSLRHTAASLLLAAGVHVKAVSERLGHASTAFTMDTYVHSLPTVQEQAAANLEELVFRPQAKAQKIRPFNETLISCEAYSILRLRSLDRGGEDMPSASNAAIGSRVTALRKARKLTQGQLAALVGLEHTQTISLIERGQRSLKAAELGRMAKALHVSPMEILAGAKGWKKPFVLWREVRDPQSRKREEAVFLERCRRYGFVEHLLGGARPSLGVKFTLDPNTTSFEEVAAWAELVRGALGLGDMPAVALGEAMEHRQQIKIFVTTLEGGSGAATRGDFGDAVLINSEEHVERRAFSLAHELFHLLTWDSLEGLPRSMTPESESRNEQLANAFASNLVLPEGALAKTLPEGSPASWRIIDWVQVAKNFGVSVPALAWRLVNLERLSRDDAGKIINDPRRAGAGERRALDEERPLPDRYVTLAFKAYVDGKISIGKLAELLETTVGVLPKELAAYGFDLESDVYEAEALPA